MSSENHPAARPAIHAIDNLRGAGWMLVSVFGASAMMLAVKYLSGEFHSLMVLAQRALFTGLLTLGLLMLVPGFRKALRFTRPRLHLLRGGLIMLGTLQGFYALGHLPTATAVALFMTAQIFAAPISVLINDETIGARRWSAIAAGFLGVLVILRPGLDGFDPMMFVALGSACSFALALSLSRSVARADGVVSAYASSVAVTAAISLPIAAPVWSMPVDGLGWFAVAILVLGGSLRSFADIEAYQLADASLLAPISYLRLALIAAAAFFLFGEAPDFYTVLGGLIVVLASLYIVQREARLRRHARAIEATPDNRV